MMLALKTGYPTFPKTSIPLICIPQEFEENIGNESVAFQKKLKEEKKNDPWYLINPFSMTTQMPGLNNKMPHDKNALILHKPSIPGTS